MEGRDQAGDKPTDWKNNTRTGLEETGQKLTRCSRLPDSCERDNEHCGSIKT